MHVNDALHPRDFALRVGGRPATVGDLLPSFDVDARVAIVSRTPGAPFGAATLLLAIVAAWYAERRARAGGEPFYEYPDCYAIQIGGEHADLGMLEVWPPRKRVVVEPDAEQVLGCLADRAIEYLLVEDGPARGGLVLRETAAAVPRHLRAAIAYAPSGRARRADVEVSGPPRAEALVAQAIADSTNVDAAVRDAARATRRRLAGEGRRAPADRDEMRAAPDRPADPPTPRPAVERARRIDLDTALGLLCPPPGAAVERPFGLTERDRAVARLADGVPRRMLTRVGPRRSATGSRST